MNPFESAEAVGRHRRGKLGESDRSRAAGLHAPPDGAQEEQIVRLADELPLRQLRVPESPARGSDLTRSASFRSPSVRESRCSETSEAAAVARERPWDVSDPGEMSEQARLERRRGRVEAPGSPESR